MEVPGKALRIGARNSIDVIRTTVDDCWGVFIPGPLIAINDDARLIAESSSFINNRGIGFYLAGGSTGTATNCTIADNKRSNVGAGGVALYDGASASFTGGVVPH